MKWLLLAFLLFPSLAHAQATVVTSCGSTTLSAGTSHFVTVDVNGQSCQSGAGSVAATSVWSASDAAANGMTLSNGGLTANNSSSAGYPSTRTTVSHSSGKFYLEFLAVGTPFGIDAFGLSDIGNSGGLSAYSNSMGIFTNNTGAGSTGAITWTINYQIGSSITPITGDVWAIAVDFGTGLFWLARNNIWFGSGNPATATSPMVSFTGTATLFPAMSIGLAGGSSWTLQPTAASQKYAPPAGFSPWN